MNKLKKILIHPGYPKTGTTFFQLHIFKKSNIFFYVGKNSQDTENEKIFQNIFRDYFCNNKIHSLDTEVYIYNYLNSISKKTNKSSLILSLENLFDVESRATKKKTFVPIDKVLLKLFNFFKRFSVKINFLIFFRDPRIVLHRYYLDRYGSYIKENIFDYSQFVKFQMKKKNSFAYSIMYEKLTKKLDKKIFEIQEETRALDNIYELVLFDFNYLTSPDKLMEYSKMYFEKELKKKEITDLKTLKIGKE